MDQIYWNVENEDLTWSDALSKNAIVISAQKEINEWDKEKAAREAYDKVKDLPPVNASMYRIMAILLLTTNTSYPQIVK